MQGKTINGFIIQHQLGLGGMAEVWYAENKIRKKAAVKLLLPKYCADESVVARFENEAKVMVDLKYPNIREVYDYETIDGRPAIIMEYLEGNDLKARMKNGQHFTQTELEKWWNQLVDTLNYTHAQGVVHRDIKPSNIFIDQHGDVKLLDFGIAKNSEGGSGTMTGSTLGTRIYMSPEQVKDPKRVDYRTDLYSLAVTFVHLLTGKSPYDSTTSSDFEIQMNIVMKPLDLSGVREPWKSFLEPYLEKEPDKRPALRGFKNSQQKVREVVKGMASDFDEGTIVATGDCQKTMENLEQTVLNNSVARKEQTEELIVTINGVSFVMKRVEGGTFWMGAHKIYEKKGLFSKEKNLTIPNFDSDAESDEQPVHGVSINSFYMGETEVIQALWKAVMGSNPSEFRGDNLPVENVSWNDCQDFIRKLNNLTGLNFRLPTEAEWEYAAKGGNKTKGYKYAGNIYIGNVAWYWKNSGNNYLNGTDAAWDLDKINRNKCKPHAVKTMEPNELGLYDMSGNVWEWCQDWYGEYSGNSHNPQGPSSGSSRVLRGGSWISLSGFCRVSFRNNNDPKGKSNSIGFRLALSKQ